MRVVLQLPRKALMGDVRMRFSATTVYDKERLLRFNHFIIFRKRFFWALMIACNVLVVLCAALVLALDPQDHTILAYAALIGIIDVAVVFCWFILPRFTLDKSPMLNADVVFEFGEENFKVFAVMKNCNDSSELNYSAIVKVMESKEDIYVFISKTQSFVMDKSGFTVGSAEELLQFLKEKNIPYKK